MIVNAGEYPAVSHFRLNLLPLQPGFIFMKYLIILAIIIYLFYKLSSFFFKVGAASQQMRNQQQRQSQTNQTKSQPKSKIKGGDYVDYEEVK